MPPESPATLRDIAKAVGVSHVTVSLALREHPRIPKKRRLQIQKAAQKLGYHPNAAATSLAHYRHASKAKPITAAIGWLNFWSDPAMLRRHKEFDAYWQGALSTAEKFGYRLEEFICGSGHLGMDRLANVLEARGIKGLLVPPQITSLPVEEFAWERFSSIRFGRSLQKPSLHIVTADQVHNAMVATNRALDLGYRRVGYISSGAYTRGHLFESGYYMALRCHHVAEQLPVLELPNDDPQTALRHFKKWFQSCKPDAIITSHPGVSSLVRKAGLQLPKDVGMATMSVLDGNCNTGIDQRPREIGRVAVLQVISQLHDNELGIPDPVRQILVQGSWVQGTMLPPRLEVSGPRISAAKKVKGSKDRPL